MRAVILTYHSGNIAGNDYANNDLLALAHDLDVVRTLHLPVVPLRQVVDTLLQRTGGPVQEKVVAITLDDGLDFDFIDLVHPFHGPQRSVYTSLRDHAEQHAAFVHATSFVIASPDARRQIARSEMLDRQWIGEQWWPEAIASGCFHLGNHSWDHMSPSVIPAGQREARAGSFDGVATFDEAHLQIAQAHAYIAARAPNPGDALFAYPYGVPSDYVANEYLPRHGERNGTLAAVTATPGIVHEGSNRWLLPRYTCGVDWRSPEDLARILTADMQAK